MRTNVKKTLIRTDIILFSYWTLLLRLLLVTVAVQGWETGVEYSYDYEGRIELSGAQPLPPEGSIRVLAQLTIQSVDDSTLLLKLSEVRIVRRGRRHGNYTLRGTPDQITLPAGTMTMAAEEKKEEGDEEEAVGDSLHLLSPFVLVHNKGSILNLMVENDEPHWSLNVKKAISSLIQLDVTGVRSFAAESAVFGERSGSLLETYEDGVTGDCSTTLQTTRLPFFKAIQHQDVCIRAEGGSNSNAYEIIKMRDFSRCRNRNPAHGFKQERSAIFKYLTCGESAERGTILRVQGQGGISASFLFPELTKFRAEESVRLVLTSRGQIHDLLPPLNQPRAVDSLNFDVTDERDHHPVSAEEFERVLKDLPLQLGEDEDRKEASPERLSRAIRLLSRLDSAQLRRTWLQFKGSRRQERQTNPDPSVKSSTSSSSRDLFIDCVAGSSGDSLPAASFILDLIVEGELQSGRALWALVSTGLAVRSAGLPLLQRFVDVIQPTLSKSLRMTALAISAELLHSSCVRQETVCHPDSRIITDDFLPLAVRELTNKAHSASDRVAVITALGILGTDDVLLLLVPYIRGENPAERIAAVLALDRLMDSSLDKVLPLLASLADNVAERPEIRMAAIRTLLFHDNTPLSVWKRMAYRTWFEPNRQVHTFTYDLIHSLSSSKSSTSSSSSKARQVMDMIRPSTPSDVVHSAGRFAEVMGLLSHGSIWRVQHSSTPAFMGYQLYSHHHQTTSGAEEVAPQRSNPLQIEIWNYNMDEQWRRLFGGHSSSAVKMTAAATGNKKENPPTPANSINLLDDYFRHGPAVEKAAEKEDHQDSVGLLHLKILGAHVFFSLEELAGAKIPQWAILLHHWQGKLAKFVQLQNWREAFPTELGLPVQLRSSLSLMVSAQGLIRSPAEINVTAALAAQWKGEVRVELPSSGNGIAVGVDMSSQFHIPLIFNISARSLIWYPPDESTQLAACHIRPYVVSFVSRMPDKGTSRNATVTANETRSSIHSIGPNLRLETETGAGPDGHISYRAIYAPDEPVISVALSASALIRQSHEDTIDFFSGMNDTMEEVEMMSNCTDEEDGYRVSLRMFYGNGSSAETHLMDVDRSYRLLLNRTEDKLRWNLSAFHHPTPRMSCTVGLEWIRTFDGVEYDYSLNGCPHLVTAEPKKYAVTVSGDDGRSNMSVRVTLEKDVIDVEPSGEVSVNGITEDVTRIRIHDGNQFLVIVERLKDESDRHHHVLVRLPGADLELRVGPQSLELSAGSLHGQVHGMCGDGDQEVTGEFKTASRCALSSGALMAASFRMNTGLNDCPALLPEEIFEALQKETYPCFSVDEQIPSALPLPPAES